MARVEREDSWAAPGKVDDVRIKVRDYCKGEKMSFSSTGDTAEAHQGSQLVTRLLGGWFVGPRQLPKKARVTVREGDEGVVVEARIEEALGLGLMDPLFKKRYDDYFVVWLDGLRAATT